MKTPFRLGASVILSAFALLGCEREAGVVAPQPDYVASAASHASSNGTTQLLEDKTEPFGTFNGIRYVRQVGRLVGRTDRGDYRVPYEIVAPEIHAQNNGAVLIEPPHIGRRLVIRDDFLGNDFLFDRGFVYASVGWSPRGNSILDPSASDAFVAGGDGSDDEQIIADFADVLLRSTQAQNLTGRLDRAYAAGWSQSHAPLHRLLHSGRPAFDLTILIGAHWPIPGQLPPGFFHGVQPPMDHEPAKGVGRIMVIQSEGDLIMFNGMSFRPGKDEHHYRVVEIAGGAHVPFFPMFMLDWRDVVRSLFVQGDRWVADGTEPPASVMIDEIQWGIEDPVYGFPTAIARDENLNALGGVRLPDLAVGRNQYIAANFSTFPLQGAIINIECEPLSDGSPRFRNHGDYVSRVTRQATTLARQGYLLDDAAAAFVEMAAESDVGKKGTCP